MSTICNNAGICTLMVIHTIIFGVVALMLTAILLYFIYGLFKNKRKSQRDRNALYPDMICGLLFLISACVLPVSLYLAHTPYFKYNHPSISSPALTVFLISWISQYFAVNLLFLAKIKQLVDRTPFKINKKVIIILHIVIIVIPIYNLIITFSVYFFPSYAVYLSSISSLTGAISMVISFLLLISIMALLLYKLKQQYERDRSRDKQILSATSKLTILNVISSISTTIVSISVIIWLRVIPWGTKTHQYYTMFHIYLILIDLITNSICVILMLHPFRIYGKKLCAPLIESCNVCWAKHIANKEADPTSSAPAPEQEDEDEDEDEAKEGSYHDNIEMVNAIVGNASNHYDKLDHMDVESEIGDTRSRDGTRLR